MRNLAFISRALLYCNIGSNLIGNIRILYNNLFCFVWLVACVRPKEREQRTHSHAQDGGLQLTHSAPLKSTQAPTSGSRITAPVCRSSLSGFELHRRAMTAAASSSAVLQTRMQDEQRQRVSRDNFESFRGPASESSSFRTRVSESASFRARPGSVLDPGGGATLLGDQTSLDRQAANQSRGTIFERLEQRELAREKAIEKLHFADASKALAQAAPRLGRELTRQNTGVIGRESYETLKRAQRRRRKRRSLQEIAESFARDVGACRLQVDPRTSRFVHAWDVLVSIAIVFTALVTPYEVSFLPMATEATNGLFIVNRIVDIIFVIDILLNFCLVYQSGADGDLIYEEDPKKIVIHYLTGWFTLDIVSVAVSAVDIYAVNLAAHQGTRDGVNTLPNTGSLNGVRALRALRALRMIKLVRLFRASRILKHVESKVEINYSLLEVGKCLLVMQMSAHLFACIWTLQAALFHESVLDSWLGNYGYCEALQPLEEGGFSPCADGWTCRRDMPGIACLEHRTLYSASIYWAVATIVSVGYGDIGATPYNASEQIICAILISFGGVIWGYVVGTFCGTIANLSPATREFRMNMNDLNTYMRKNRVEPMLQIRLREYFHRTRHLHDALNEGRLLEMMSPNLQSEVVLAVNARWLREVWFLQDVEPEFVVRLTLGLSPLVLAPFELAPCGFLYILAQGVVLVGGDLLMRGKVWGDDIILGAVAPHLVRPINAKAMNYAEVYLCSWLALQAAVDGFPASALHIRKCAIRLAMRRQILRAAAAVKRDRARGEGSVVAMAANTSGLHSNAKKTKKTSFAGMLGNASSATESESQLQAQLIDMRRAKSAPNALSSRIVSSPKVSTPSMDAHPGRSTDKSPIRSTGVVVAAGWEKRGDRTSKDGQDIVNVGDPPGKRHGILRSVFADSGQANDSQPHARGRNHDEQLANISRGLPNEDVMRKLTASIDSLMSTVAHQTVMLERLVGAEGANKTGDTSRPSAALTA